MPAFTTNDAVACLRSVGLPVTLQRVEIARVLFARPAHLSADQVWTLVRESSPETSRSTVYNTLNRFVDKRLIRELLVEPGRVIYDSNMTPHHHLYRSDTGEVTDLPTESLRLIGTPLLPDDVELEQVDVVVRVRAKAAAREACNAA